MRHLLAASLAVVSFAGCSPIVWHGPFEGRILAADTGAPIPGAAIAVFYYYHSVSFHPRSIRVFFGHDIVEAYTAHDVIADDRGRFSLPALRRLNLRPFSFVDDPRFSVFAKGYEGCEMARRESEQCGHPDIRLRPVDPNDPNSRREEYVSVSTRFEQMVPTFLGAVQRAKSKTQPESHSGGGSSPW